jgi:hypothetical protein
MVRFIIGLIVSFIAGAVLFVLAAMADGMSHSMDAMFTLFPYGTFVTMRTSWENTGLVLTFIQFPVYVLVVMILKGKRARIAAVLAIVAFHIITARVELRSYERSRGSLITSSAPRRGVMFIARDHIEFCTPLGVRCRL